MQIIIKQTADALDPNGTTNNPDLSLALYVAELTAEILKEFPDAEIEHEEIDDPDGTIQVLDDPDGSMQTEIEDIDWRVYEAGNFWA